MAEPVHAAMGLRGDIVGFAISMARSYVGLIK